tara:strand:+ start:738 stop:1682 length:945 start_codon:yes stop_codon:yes gene_type:complete
MKYVGLQQQITTNNRKSILLLFAFPAILLTGLYIVLIFLSPGSTNEAFLSATPYVLGFTGAWFLIGFLGHSRMINYATGSKSLERKENMRVYNLTENLCMSVGMKMPILRIIESPALNAYASGLNEKNYTVTLTRGIIDKLDDDELEGVIAHELMHIRNNDVRLLIISIIFVGIFSGIFESVIRNGGGRRNSRKKDGKGGFIIALIILLVSVSMYLLSIFVKFSLSRKREYLADAGAAEMTKNPLGLANALRKISGNSSLDNLKNNDVRQMFIDNGPGKRTPSFISEIKLIKRIASIFATHPPIEERITLLEQF